MDSTAVSLCQSIAGAKLAYVQSDEISILLTDFDSTQTEAWFDGNVQKMATVSASIATAAFNKERLARISQGAILPEWALFDSRVWSIPSREEVFNYFIWRQQDASRNSVSMTARAYFDQKRLHALTVNQLQELLWQEQGINWNDMPAGFKRGRAVVPVIEEKSATFVDPRTQEERVVEGVERRTWSIVDPPIFTQNRGWLQVYVPEMH